MNRLKRAWVAGALLSLTQACVQSPPPSARTGDLDRARKLLGSLERFVPPEALQANYVGALVGAFEIDSVGGNGAPERLFLAWLKPEGFYCWHNVELGGMEDPEHLPDHTEGTRMVAFNERGLPLYQVSITPWSKMALMDVDGDPATAELMLWSERCEGDDPPFLKILRLSPEGCRPMLDLVLNPAAPSDSRIRVEEEVIQTPEGPRTEYNIHRLVWPNRRGRWRFEGNTLLIQELKGILYETVARFPFDRSADAWSGPAGGDAELWKSAGGAWIQSEFLSFADLDPGDRLKGAGLGSLRRDVDHLKAAEEAAREAGLKK